MPVNESTNFDLSANSQSSTLNLVQPDWPAPQTVFACCTTRTGGVSEQVFSSLNLATHVDDNLQHVMTNRQRLYSALKLPAEPQWLNQTHSIRVIDLDKDSTREGDAAITATMGKVAVVLTADCLPVLFCNRQGSEVAASHAGWKGLLNGVLEQTVSTMKSAPHDLMAWMGPAIGANRFEVGMEVRDVFLQLDGQLESCFKASRPGHFLADLYAIARIRLKNQGITSIYGGEYCTFTQNELFFSYRREKMTGRQASLIYIKK